MNRKRKQLEKRALKYKAWSRDKLLQRLLWNLMPYDEYCQVADEARAPTCKATNFWGLNKWSVVMLVLLLEDLGAIEYTKEYPQKLQEEP